MSTNSPEQGAANQPDPAPPPTPAWGCPSCGQANPPTPGGTLRCAACGWAKPASESPPALPDSAAPELRLPWADPTAYVALALTALGAFILRQPIAAFIGFIITMAGLGFFLAGFALAVAVQNRCCEDTDGQTTTAQGLLNVACLGWLFGSVLLAVSPLFLSVSKEAAPLNVAYAMFGFLLSFLPASVLPRIASARMEESPERWMLTSAYWLTYVLAAAACSTAFHAMGWRGGN